MKVKNEPIMLSGRVYLDGILCQDLPSLALPAILLPGDIKVHNVLKPGSRLRFGQTVTFSGFMVANVYDGKRFRRLLLRKRGAVESTYKGTVERRERSAAIVRYLRTLVRREAVWHVQDKGYEVSYASALSSVEQTKPLAAPASQIASSTVVETKTAAVVEPHGLAANAVVHSTATAAPNKPTATAHRLLARRRRRRKNVCENQLPLFTDLP